MPGNVSLQATQYYAHPRNAFWFIIESLFSDKINLSYSERQKLIVEHHVAVWDVLASCDRNGSLDSSIKASSIVANDFVNFFNINPTIKTVFFNGGTAEKVFMKAFKTASFLDNDELNFIRLPSTSPAHAAMTKQQKLQSWRVVVEHLATARKNFQK